MLMISIGTMTMRFWTKKRYNKRLISEIIYIEKQTNSLSLQQDTDLLNSIFRYYSLNYGLPSSLRLRNGVVERVVGIKYKNIILFSK